MPDLRLPGCGSRPLIGYLKALGLLRAVSRQSDSSVRGRWKGTAFELRTTLSEQELSEFLLDDFRPSPVLSPWNGRSGFYSHANKTAVEALAAVEHAEGDRFEAYRSLIAQTREILDTLGISEKPAPGAEKNALVWTLRMQWPDEAVEWLDAAIVLAGDTPAFPPLLGSGGNEGSYDFSSNYMQAVVRALRSADLLASALWGSSARLERMKLAHFQGDFSPTNSPAGDASSLGNPWDLVLAVEGSLALVGGAARRHADGAAGGLMTAPFTVRPTATGEGATVPVEEGAELWLPLWNGWATYAEITNLIRESRAQVKSGRTLRAARSGLDFARAAGELGVARGIDAFERYTILERSGQSNLAVPAGRIEVAPRASAAALASIDPWLGSLLRFARADNCPAGLAREIRRLERACFQMAARGNELDTLATLEQMGAVEGTLARSSTAIDSGVRPLRGALAGPWIAAAHDGSPELAVAVSVASMRTDDRQAPAMRDYFHGTTERGREFDRSRRHLVSARASAGLLAAVHARSHLESQRTTRERNGGDRRLGLEHGTWCDLRASRLLATGRLETNRIIRLARGLVLLEHHHSKGAVSRQREVPSSPAPAYDMLALAWWWRLPREHLEPGSSPGPRPGWAARLAQGAAGSVLRDASIRLRMAGMAPVAGWRDLQVGAPPGDLLAAALLSPLSNLDLARLHQTVTDTTQEEER